MLEKIRRTTTIIGLLTVCIFSTIFLCLILDQLEFPKLRAPKPLPGGVWLYPQESPLLDLPRFKYLINNDVCQGDSSLIAVLIITSHAGDVKARAARRNAISVTELRRLKLRQVFLLATTTKKQTGYNLMSQQKIYEENKIYGDLIQGNFEEAYRNLSYKHVMGLQWVVDYCYSVKYIIKLDDDIAVNIYQLLNVIKKNPINNAMAGYVLNGMSPERSVSKWKVTHKEWQSPNYPKFLSGWLYITTPKVASNLVQALQNNFFWIDDVFVTGVATQIAKVPLIDLSEYFALHVESLQCCMQGDECNFIVAPSSGDWSLLERYLRYTVIKQGVLRSHNHGHHCVVTGNPNAWPMGPGVGQMKAVRL